VTLSVSPHSGATAADAHAPASRTPTNGHSSGVWLTQRFVTSWSPISRWYRAAATAILALTIFLRLWRLDLVEFKDDQAAALRLAEDMVRLGRVPLAGMTSSIGIPLAPTFEYLLLPVVAVSRDPRLATAAIGLANVAGVAGTLLLGWRWFSPQAGLVAGLVFATNPWAVFYARKVWNQDVMAPTAVLLMFCLDNAFVGEQVGWGVAAFPVFALGVECHPSFALLTPLLVVLGVVLVRRGHFKHFAVGLGLAALTAAPYTIYLVQTQASDLLAPASSGGKPLQGQSLQIDAAGAGSVLGLIGGWHNWNVEGLDINSLLPWRLAAAPGAIETLLLALGITAAFMLIAGSRQAADRLRAGGLLLWVLVPTLLTIAHPIPLYDYYFLFVLPAGALLVGLGLHALGQFTRSRRTGRMLVPAALAATIVVAALQSTLVLRQLGYLTTGYAVTYGPPLAVAEQTTRELLDLVNRGGARELSVEIDDVNDAAIGYLARPYVPEVHVALRRRGPWNVDFDLPNQSASPPYALTAAPQLTAPEPVGASYADGVKVLSVSTTRVVSPGGFVGLALTWTLDHPSPEALTRRLLWELSLYDPLGHEDGRVAGIPHAWADLADGKVVVSWITVSTDRDATEGVYQVHLDRLDPVTREPLTAIGTDAEWSAGTVEVRRN
jgi:hypothetical protein